MTAGPATLILAIKELREDLLMLQTQLEDIRITVAQIQNRIDPGN